MFKTFIMNWLVLMGFVAAVTLIIFGAFLSLNALETGSWTQGGIGLSLLAVTITGLIAYADAYLN